MRAIWKGSISFGLVNIPIALFPASRSEELKFRLLRHKDLSPVNYKRVAEADGKEVPWAQIVKATSMRRESSSSSVRKTSSAWTSRRRRPWTSCHLWSSMRVNPVFFHKPYYMEPQKGGDRAYVLLRQALKESGKIGIAKVVIKTRQHLAAVKPQDQGLMLELMHFADELHEVADFKLPHATTAGKKEMDMAKSLISSMTEKWNPEDYKDDYRNAP